MAQAVLASFVKRMSSFVLQASTSATEPSSSAEQELHDLEDTVKRIQAVLEDAEEKDISDKSEQLRLRELKEVTYDAEDAVDEYEYEVLRTKVEARRQAMESHANDGKRADKVIFDLNYYHPKISISDELKSRIREIRGRFAKITDDWDRISLREKDGKRRRIKKWKPLETTCCFDKDKIFGRQDEKEKIIEWLLEGRNDANQGRVLVLPIVGMGGLGKTTLAQMAYDDPRVCQRFDYKGWICVSEDFDVENLMKKICSSFDIVVNSYMSLNKIFEIIKKKLKGKEFFLVLDDVWNQRFDLWNSLKTHLVAAGQGKILMTTRNDSVAKIMQTTTPIKLEVLSFDDCWSLFSKIAFGSRDYNLDLNFLNTGKKIVEMCRGLPLAIKVLASFLSVENEETWIQISDSKLWELDDEKVGIFPALKLSYYHMPAELRPCFIYLSLFPKDSELKQSRIVQQWMAHGFLKTEGKKREEDIGNAYFKELFHRSIIQRHTHSRGRFMMHDLIHDLAQDLGKSEYLFISLSELYEQMIPRTIRHLSIYISDKFEVKELDPLFKIRLRLRTLMIHSVKESPIINMMPHLMHGLTNLRALSFQVYQFRREEINLDFVGTLKHLRYLRSNMDINYIPKSLYQLYYLQTLDLWHNSFNFSEGIGDLVNLRNFSVPSRYGLPQEVTELTNLQKLRHFVVGDKSWSCKLRHLKDFPNLRGKLVVSGLETVEPSDFTPSEVYLKDKTRIVQLWLEWNRDSNRTVVCDGKLAEEVLECLRPHLNIKIFGLSKYPGVVLPTWLGSFSKLESFCLWCTNIISLPTLGQLPNLKSLYIEGMEKVKCVGRELLSSGAEGVKRSSFPSLKLLYFRENSKLKEWHGVEACDLPCLGHVCLHRCPKLRNFPHLAALDSLSIICCPELRLPPLPSVTELRFCTEWNHELLMGDNLPKLRDLFISELKVDLLVFPASQIVRSIEKLSISYCKEVMTLSGLGNFTSLRHLVIHKCRHLHISPNERLPLNLQDVEIHQSPYAKRWYQHQVCDHQMDLESEDDDDVYGFEGGMSMNSESEQDEVNYDIEGNI